MDALQPTLDYFSQNPGWALAVVFLIAFGEALLIIGLFVPSTAILVGAGMLVGTGHLSFWAVFAATAVGAILGDQLSYWAGRLYGDRLKTLWPLRLYPTLVARGETFVTRHGGKSIAIGRFVPGVKAVVPGIVGMFGMGQLHFAAVNISSGLAWALAHVVPGMLAGQVLALAGELSERLLIVLLVLLALLFVLGWLIRLGVGGVLPWIAEFQGRLYRWSLTRREKGWRRLGRRLAPHNPRAIGLIVMGLLALVALALFLRLAGLALATDTISNTDLSVHGLMQGLRNAPADQLMLWITMFGDRWVILALGAAMVLWLAWRRAGRAALAALVALAAAEAIGSGVKLFVGRPRPGMFEGFAGSFAFPSGHATLAAACFGMLAILAGRSLGRWGRALVYSAASLAAIAIGYSRLYLGVHWFSDVVGGLLIGAVIAAAFGIAVETVPPRRLMPLRLAASALAVYVSAGWVYIATNHDFQAARYVERSATVRLKLGDWQAGQWAAIPARRVDLAGKPEEAFVAQWAGDTGALGLALARAGWDASPRWTWQAALPYLDPHKELADLLPRPALHQGRQAELTFIHPLPEQAARRLVVRVWKTDFEIDDGARVRPLHLVSVSRDVLRRGFNLYAVPSVQGAEASEVAGALQTLRTATDTVALAAAGAGKDTVATLLLASP